MARSLRRRRIRLEESYEDAPRPDAGGLAGAAARRRAGPGPRAGTTPRTAAAGVERDREARGRVERCQARPGERARSWPRPDLHLAGKLPPGGTAPRGGVGEASTSAGRRGPPRRSPCPPCRVGPRPRSWAILAAAARRTASVRSAIGPHHRAATGSAGAPKLGRDLDAAPKPRRRGARRPGRSIADHGTDPFSSARDKKRSPIPLGRSEPPKRLGDPRSARA